MASEGYHVPYEKLTRKTILYHFAVVSLQEELEATDWYRQRADACDDEALREILLHNMREEMEHACMIIEWLRRNDADWANQLDTYLYTDAPITQVEEVAEGRESDEAVEAITGQRPGRSAEERAAEGHGPKRPNRRFTVGNLREGD